MERQKRADRRSQGNKAAPSSSRKRARTYDERLRNYGIDEPDRGICGLMEKLPNYFLYEFCRGYALILAHDLPDFGSEFEVIDEFISRPFDQHFKVVAFYPFQSAADALIQFKAVSDGKVTKELTDFILKSLPAPYQDEKPCFAVAFADPFLQNHCFYVTTIPSTCGAFHTHIMRCFRMNVDKIIKGMTGMTPVELGKVQRELALSHSKEAIETLKRSRKTKSMKIDCMGEGSCHPPSSSFVEPVPHPTLEGIFVGNGNALYTKNLVPGEAHSNEILLPVQNEDGSVVEYREWHPSRSKLAAAILSGADNIWIKPGSFVLYLNVGDDCVATISHISDIVGHEGLVYIVEEKNVEALVKMAEKRLNIVPIIQNPMCANKYRMLIGMVDVLFAAPGDADYEICIAAASANHYLKAGGHYVFCVKANRVDPIGQCNEVFSFLGERKKRQYKQLKQVTLKPFDEDHAYVIGGFRHPAYIRH